MRRLRPWHIVVFGWLVLGVLAGGKWLIGGEADRQRGREAEGVVIDGDTVDAFVALTSQEPVVKEQEATLERFFLALKTAGTQSIRVVHFGDSQIEQDRISMTLRRHWQHQYGGSGLGLVPVMQTVPTYTLDQTLTMNGQPVLYTGGPKRYFVYGPKTLRREENNRYGVMGQVTVMNDSLVKGSEELRLTFAPRKQVDDEYTRVRLWADSSITMEVEDKHVVVLRGRGDVYGLSLEGKTGVYVDNIPMRGSAGTMFTNMDEALLRDYFTKTNTRLIIMQYGGNALPNIQSHSLVTETVNALGRQVQFLQQAAPEADVLFIGPSDMLVNEQGEMHSDPMVMYMDRQLEKMASKRGIVYFSTFQAMGGENAMLRWQEQGLAGDDGIHFTKKGADLIAEKIVDFINSKLLNETTSLNFKL